jgi:prolyl 4-hydroxylase
MSALVNFSPELRDWIGLNLRRGCQEGVLVDAMMTQGFELHVARGLVTAFSTALARGEPLPADSVVLAPQDYEPDPPRLPPGNRIRADGHDVDVLMRLQRPCIALLGNVLSADDCAAVIELGRARLTPSTIVDPGSGMDRVAAHRSSEGMFFGLCENEFIARIDRRVSALMGLPVEHGEGLQLLHYGPGCHSSPHYDFLVPQNDANRASIARSGQRVSTLVMYLNDIAAGGATTFPELGLAVAPRAGNAVYFEYANRAGQLDHATLHAGAQVETGEKWVLTKWMRARPFIAAPR